MQTNLLKAEKEPKPAPGAPKSSHKHPHADRYLGVNHFCKQCSLYLPELGSQALRCSQLEGNLTGINPNDEFSQMLRKVKRKRVLSEMGKADRQDRQRAVEAISGLANRLNLSSIIIGSAITHFDLFLDNRGHLSFQKQEIATVCLLLATKFHESRFASELKSHQVAVHAKKQVGDRALKMLELEVASELDWAFDSQTCVHFLRFLLSKGTHRSPGVVFTSDRHVVELCEKDREEKLKKVYIVAHNAAMAALFDHSYFSRQPLFVAAACIAFGRTFSGVLPAWPEELEKLTGLKWVEFEDIYQGLLAAHKPRLAEPQPGIPRARTQADENAHPESQYLGKRVTIRELRSSFLASKAGPQPPLLHNR